MPQKEAINALCDMHDVPTDSISMQPTSDCMQCLDKYACWSLELCRCPSHYHTISIKEQCISLPTLKRHASPPTLLSLGVEVCAQLLKRQIAEEVAK